MQRPRQPQRSIDTLAHQFRDTVNLEDIHSRLVARGKKEFEQICASMDVLRDTVEAIDAHRAIADEKHTHGILYLMTYGLLQALILQQDALKHAAESIDFTYRFPKELLDIREIRNDAIGHPTQRGKEPFRHFGISRISMDGSGFTLHNFDWRLGQTQSIRFADLIETQTQSVSATLERMIAHLLALQ